MKTFALVALAAAASATEWGRAYGNPYGDYYSGYKMGRGARRASPAMPRFGGPDKVRRGPSRPTPRYGSPTPRMGRPSPKGYMGKGYGSTAMNVVGDGMGDGYGHGRGFAKDDIQNLEVDLVDKDREFEIEANMKDYDVEDDLEIKMADQDIESELEDRRDHTTVDRQLWDGAVYTGLSGYGYGGYDGIGGYNGHGSVRQQALIQNLGERQKRHDQSYNLNQYGGYVEAGDSGSLNRGSYSGYGRTDGNANKSYQNMRYNQGPSQNAYDQDEWGYGGGRTMGYGSTYGSNYGTGYGGYGGYGGSTVTYGQAAHAGGYGG